MATFRQRKSGLWQAIIRKKNYAPQSATFPTLVDAENWATVKESEMIRGRFSDNKEAEQTMLMDCLVKYEEIAKQHKGYEAERYRIDSWKAHRLATRSIASLCSNDFHSFRDKRRRDGISDATIRLDLAVISAIFKHFDYGISNPASKTLATLKSAAKRSRRLSEIEQKYLLDALNDTQCSDKARSNKWIPIVTIFAIETAARLSEIVGKDKTEKPGLLWENTNIDKAVAKLVDTKNGKSRYVPLSPAALDCLRQARALETKLRGPVFNTTSSAIKQSWQRAKRRARNQYLADGGKDKNFLVDFRFHDNRHEAASRWARTFDHLHLKLITGHEDDRSLSRYVNHNEDDVALIAARMAEVQKKEAAG